MAMKGLSLDGAEKLKKALDAYAKACDISTYNIKIGASADEAYGKKSPVAKTMTALLVVVTLLMGVQGGTIAGYQNQLNQIIAAYKKFDNSGKNTIGKIGSSLNSSSNKS